MLLLWFGVTTIPEFKSTIGMEEENPVKTKATFRQRVEMKRNGKYEKAYTQAMHARTHTQTEIVRCTQRPTG